MAETIKPVRAKAKRALQERGLVRYNQLLDAAHALLIEHEIKDLGIYQIAQKAHIPPASAYHFFPTVGAVLLGLAQRYLGELRQLMLDIHTPEDMQWQTFLKGQLTASAAAYEANPPMRKLILGGHTTCELVMCNIVFNEAVVQQLVDVYDKMFYMPVIRDAQRKYLVALAAVDAIWSLSQTRHGCITAEYLEESTVVAIAYCRTFLPEKIEPRELVPAGSV